MNKEFIGALAHQAEIINSRIGGFGGSDARLFYKVGLKGLASLSATDKKRIAVAMGKAQPVTITPNEAMKRGHRFEDFMATTKTNFIREHKMSADLAQHFKTFAHADFFDKKTGTVLECKCTKDGSIAAQEDYAAQLQWYYLLGAKKVVLVHHPQHEPFMVNAVDHVDIDRDERFIDALREGIRLVDDYVGEGYEYDQQLEWTIGDLLVHEQADVITLGSLMKRIKEAEAKVDEFRSRILEMMRENGIQKLTANDCTITYIAPAERRTFDKAALAKAHPELDLSQFVKVSQVKDSIKVDVK